MNYTILRESTPLAIRNQLIDIVVTRKIDSDREYSGVRMRLPRLYDLYRGTYSGPRAAHKNNVHLPLIFSAVWSDAARKAATSLAEYPYLRFTGFGADDDPIAHKWESLISAQMSDMDIFQKLVHLYVVSDLYGVGISQVVWRRTEETRIIEDLRTAPLSGQTIRSIRKGKVITFDGPDIENVDRLDFSPQPRRNCIERMDYVIRRTLLDLDTVRALTAAGMFDKAELDRLERESGGNPDVSDEAAARRFNFRLGATDNDARTLDRYSRPVEILEYWGRIPSELAPDGVLERVITVANRRFLLRNRPNPFWHGRKPFVAFSPTPDPHYFDAPGKAEVAEKLQITANRFLNQMLDAADLTIDPVWFFDRASNLNTRGLIAKPGRFIGVDGDPNKVVAPLLANLQGIALAQGQIEMVNQALQQGTGLYDESMQGGGDSRMTARQFLGQREAAGTRLNLESMIFEKMYFEPAGNMMVANDKQFLETPVEVLILGDSSRIDPNTGEPIPTQRERLEGRDLVPSYQARAMGASMALATSTAQANVQAIAQNIAAFPQVVGSINMVNFFRQMFRLFRIPNVNAFFVEQKQGPLQNFLQNASAGNGIGAVPNSRQLAGGALPPGLDMGAVTPTGLPSMAGEGTANDPMQQMMGAAA